MAGAEQQELRREIREERARLTDEVGVLRGELARATNIGGRLRSKLPVAAAGALGLGFLRAGGIGATMRLLMRRSREGEQKAKAGRLELIRRKRS
jgi:hypothetical protein